MDKDVEQYYEDRIEEMEAVISESKRTVYIWSALNIVIWMPLYLFDFLLKVLAKAAHWVYNFTNNLSLMSYVPKIRSDEMLKAKRELDSATIEINRLKRRRRDMIRKSEEDNSVVMGEDGRPEVIPGGIPEGVENV